jgi:hypothetical protein
VVQKWLEMAYCWFEDGAYDDLLLDGFKPLRELTGDEVWNDLREYLDDDDDSQEQGEP